MEDNRGVSYFFLGLGIGVAVGVLFAPKSGEETREVLRSKAGEGKDYLRQRGENLRGAAGEYVERGKTVIQRQKETLTAAVDAGRAAYREAVSPARNPTESDLAGEGV